MQLRFAARPSVISWLLWKWGWKMSKFQHQDCAFVPAVWTQQHKAYSEYYYIMYQTIVDRPKKAIKKCDVNSLSEWDVHISFSQRRNCRILNLLKKFHRWNTWISLFYLQNIKFEETGSRERVGIDWSSDRFWWPMIIDRSFWMRLAPRSSSAGMKPHGTWEGNVDAELWQILCSLLAFI